MLSKANLALVYAVDQMLDYYVLNDKPLPAAVSVTKNTYDALLDYTREQKGVQIMQLTHYRTVPVNIVKANTVT